MSSNAFLVSEMMGSLRFLDVQLRGAGWLTGTVTDEAAIAQRPTDGSWQDRRVPGCSRVWGSVSWDKLFFLKHCLLQGF